MRRRTSRKPSIQKHRELFASRSEPVLMKVINQHDVAARTGFLRIEDPAAIRRDRNTGNEVIVGFKDRPYLLSGEFKVPDGSGRAGRDKISAEGREGPETGVAHPRQSLNFCFRTQARRQSHFLQSRFPIMAGKIDCFPIQRLLWIEPFNVPGQGNSISTGRGTTIDSHPSGLVGFEIDPLCVMRPVWAYQIRYICDELSRLSLDHIGDKYLPVPTGKRVERYPRSIG
jgi:hypothetical protein